MQSTVSTNPLGAGVWRAAFITGLAVAAVAAVQPAHARDNVIWSVGVASPGVSIGLSNAAPVYVQPAPVYVQPAPVYVQPAPVSAVTEAFLSGSIESVELIPSLSGLVGTE